LSNVEVNLDELRGQIAGYNLAAASLTAKLVTTEQPSVEVLGEMVRELEELAQRRGTLNLYLGLLESTDVQSCGAPKAIEPIVTAIASKISLLRGQLASGTESTGKVANLRARLALLSKRLAQLTVNGDST
jgi:hypothetical protein